jgi:hypothetical protein
MINGKAKDSGQRVAGIALKFFNHTTVTKHLNFIAFSKDSLPTFML